MEKGDSHQKKCLEPVVAHRSSPQPMHSSLLPPSPQQANRTQTPCATAIQAPFTASLPPQTPPLASQSPATYLRPSSATHEANQPKASALRRRRGGPRPRAPAHRQPTTLHRRALPPETAPLASQSPRNIPPPSLRHPPRKPTDRKHPPPPPRWPGASSPGPPPAKHRAPGEHPRHRSPVPVSSTPRPPISPFPKPSPKTSLAIATGCRRPHPRPPRSAAIMVLSGTHRRTVKRRRRHAVRAKINERSQFFTLRGKTGSLKSITYDFRGRRRVNY